MLNEEVKIERQLRDSFTIIYNFLFDSLILNNNAKMYYLQLLRFAGQNSIAFPGMDKLQYRLCLGSRPTLVKIMKFWEWTGFIDVYRREDPHKKQKLVNHYFLKDQDLQEFLRLHEEKLKKLNTKPDGFPYKYKIDVQMQDLYLYFIRTEKPDNPKKVLEEMIEKEKIKQLNKEEEKNNDRKKSLLE